MKCIIKNARVTIYESTAQICISLRLITQVNIYFAAIFNELFLK